MTAARRPPRRIGVLGGMGPEATVLLMSRIIAATPAEDDCDHIPLLVDSNTQVPSRIAALIEGHGADPAPVLADMARRLERQGADALIMPCNTAHNYAAAIRDAVEIPFVDMIVETVAAIQSISPRTAHIGVLASPATRMTGIFETVFGPAGYNLIWPEDEGGVLDIIRYIKRHGADDTALARLQGAATASEARDVQALLVGCTEFSLLTTKLDVSCPVIDTLEILVERAVAFALGVGEAQAPRLQR